MTEKIEIILFSAKNYFRTSLLTIFENIPILKLVGVFPIQHLLNADLSLICCDLLVCTIQENEFHIYEPVIQQILLTNPQQKILIVGTGGNNLPLTNNVIFHPNLTQLSKQTVEIYLDRLFFTHPIKNSNHQIGEKNETD